MRYPAKKRADGQDDQRDDHEQRLVIVMCRDRHGRDRRSDVHRARVIAVAGMHPWARDRAMAGGGSGITSGPSEDPEIKPEV